jgi:hypothetical protein
MTKEKINAILAELETIKAGLTRAEGMIGGKQNEEGMTLLLRQVRAQNAVLRETMNMMLDELDAEGD